jgi:glycine/D-amino acid oxidase-like deaminating enzyme
VKKTKYASVSADFKTETLVAGGGMAGLINAIQLAEAGYEVSLVESRELTHGTSSHTTAKLTYEHFTPYHQFINQFGERKAKIYADSQKEALQLYRDIIEKYDIDCDFEGMSNYLVTNKDDETMLKNEYEVHQLINIESELHEGDQGLPFPTSMGLEIKSQAQFNPAKFMVGIIQAADRLGVKFYEHSAIESVSNHTALVNNHKITFDKLIIATQYPLPVEGDNPYRLQPERAYIVTTDSYADFPKHFYQYFGDPTLSIRHFLNENGKRELILAGGNHLTGKSKNTNESYNLLENSAKEMFNAQSINRKWTAQDLNTIDGVPYIGYHSNQNKDIFVVTGFNKFGMLFSAVSSNIILAYLRGETHNAAHLVDPLRALKLPIGAGIYYDNEQLKAIYKTEDTVRKVSPYCTHCHNLLVFNNAELSWDCPNDGSSFSVDGKITQGPATDELINLK